MTSTQLFESSDIYASQATDLSLEVMFHYSTSPAFGDPLHEPWMSYNYDPPSPRPEGKAVDVRAAVPAARVAAAALAQAARVRPADVAAARGRVAPGRPGAAPARAQVRRREVQGA